jgi:hypothetical protein
VDQPLNELLPDIIAGDVTVGNLSRSQKLVEGHRLGSEWHWRTWRCRHELTKKTRFQLGLQVPLYPSPTPAVKAIRLFDFTTWHGKKTILESF